MLDYTQLYYCSIMNVCMLNLVRDICTVEYHHIMNLIYIDCSFFRCENKLLDASHQRVHIEF
jgi:hypothetical protein